MKRIAWSLLAGLLCCGLIAGALFGIAVPTANAYVDISPSLGQIIKDAESICVFQVDKVSVEKRIVVYKKVADLRGRFPDGVIRHHLAEGFHPREPRIVLDWAEPGEKAIAFINGRSCLVCIGNYWYECASTRDGWWAMTTGRPELSLAFFGPADNLAEALVDILQGKEAVITAITHGDKQGVYQYSSVAFQKVLRGKDCPVWRLKASLDMPQSVWRVSARDSKWIVGPGAAGPEDVPDLIEDLKSNEVRKRIKAADDLGLVGWKARAALPVLAKLCDDSDPFTSISAARSMMLISEVSALPMNTLKESLKSTDAKARKAAAIALGDLGVDAKVAVPALRDALKDKEAPVRWSVAEALGRIGADAANAVPALAKALRDPDIREIAADSLGAIGPAARGAVPLLQDAVKDNTNAEFRWAAAIALTRIDAKSAKMALPLFIDKLTNGDHRACWDACMYLAPMGLEAKAAAPAVRVLVQYGNGVASETLAAIAGPDAIDALPILLHIMTDDWDTTQAIFNIGPTALPDVLKQLKNPENANKHLLVKALGLLSSKTPAAIPPIIDALSSPEASVRKAAALALAKIDPLPRTAITGLRKVLNDGDPAVRLAGAAALRALGSEESIPAVKSLQGLLTQDEPKLRRDAAAALGQFGAPAKSALPVLTGMVKDPDAGVRSAAAWSVARITAASANREAMSVMVAALKDEDPRARLDAIRFLSAVGPDAREVITALTDARHDEDDDVRRAAAEALAKILAKQ